MAEAIPETAPPGLSSGQLHRRAGLAATTDYRRVLSGWLCAPVAAIRN